ncbi:hypothetical protein A3A09_00425 [Candidatus Nomurabacteria bacterium RIFCSPLOWO2_01_FULL_42_20]|nr:MAG: hypothetical protein A3A09_00425 [Candidatus Nomurabacteria bacterium RIFCSPLOWO2_01_FULL_42_20]
MSTIILPKIKYEVLEKKANLYDRFFKRIARSFFETEDYSAARIREFMKEDKLSKKTSAKIRKILSS